MTRRRANGWPAYNFSNGPRFGSFMGGFNPYMMAPQVLASVSDQVDRYIPFDMVLAEPAIPTVMPPTQLSEANSTNDSSIESAINNRLKVLIPTEKEKCSLELIVKKVQSVLEELKNYTGDDADSKKAEEVHLVGSYKRGTMMAGVNMVDIVVFLKVLPTTGIVETFSNNVLQLLKSANVDSEETKLDPALYSLKVNEKGFTLEHPIASANILITTSSRVLKAEKIDSSVSLHVNEPAIKQAWWQVQQAEWLEKNASDASLKNLSLILRDVSRRFSGFSALSSWMVDVFSCYLIKNQPTGEDLSIARAFRRFFEVVSAGFLLPESTAISDPCHPSKKPIHFRMPLEDQDEITTTAQNLLRILCHGGYNTILGNEENTENTEKVLNNERSVWSGVVVSPLEKAYNKNLE